MKKVYESIARFGQEWEGDVCLALGMFDGVHRGHQAVLDLVIRTADQCQGAAAAAPDFSCTSRFFFKARQRTFFVDESEW